MMKLNEYKKNHICFIFEEVVKSIKGLFVFIVLCFANLDEGGIYGVLILILLCVINSILKWIMIEFYINNNELIYKSGIINKKKLEIPFNKINTIDINKNIIDKMFNICTLKVDTGAVKEVGQEIKIKINKEEAYKIRNFINGINQFNFNHFTFIGNIDRMVINLKSGKNEYEISKDDYISDKDHFRGINHAFIMSALNHIYIKKTILNLLAETTYIDTPLHKEWLNKLEKTIIQGYSLKYLPSHNLRSELDKNFIDDREFDFIQKIHFENTNNIISKQQEVTDSKINFLNVIILIFTIISLGQIIDIFTDD
ncbi:PH domain-containing protein, partial [Clostridium sp.]|uniref:PH domain-containing protein n=1 Tax=Clostridium sp. TaxID=1506 RepID=UPI0028FE6E89